MLRVPVCATYMGAVLAQNPLNKGHNGWFSAKINHKTGYESKFQ